MINKKDLHVSKFLCLVLRHKPELLNLNMDKYGYVCVEELIKGMTKKGMIVNKNDMRRIVEEDDKGRYSYALSDTQDRIRANYGHSIKVDLELNKVSPPLNLYHGTASKNLNKIFIEGLDKCKRQYVHLSDNIKTAISVGKRHGDVILFKVDTTSMLSDGCEFYCSENGTYLIDNIPPKYLTLVDGIDYKYIIDCNIENYHKTKICSSYFTNKQLYDIILKSDRIQSMLETGTLYGSAYSNFDSIKEAMVMDMKKVEIKVINIYKENGAIFGDIKVIINDTVLNPYIESLFNGDKAVLVPVGVGVVGDPDTCIIFRFNYILKSVFRGKLKELVTNE